MNIQESQEIQEIFNKVIDAGYFDKTILFVRMCFSLSEATHDDVITADERDAGYEAIEQYMLGFQQMFLESILNELELPSSFEDRLSIYRDWKNHPKLG